MSSSRSITAARNRRAGEAPIKMQTANRPMTSIASGPAMTQQQSQSQYQSQTQQVKSNGLPFQKLTISDAVGLITLRLGKVEQFLIDNQSNLSSTDIPTNTKLIDNSLLQNIISRLDALEKAKSNNVLEELNVIKEQLKDVNSILLSFKEETEIKISELESNVTSKVNDKMDFQVSEDVDTVAEDESLVDTESVVETESVVQVEEPKKKGGRRKKVNL
jgi:hypothetical protein